MTRRVLVTGASSGIGRATAERFVAGGAQVVGTSRLGGTGSSYPLIPLEQSCPQQSRDAVDRAAELLGGIDVAVLNAGTLADQLAVRMSADQFDQVVRTNLSGGFYVAQASLRHLRRSSAGRLVLVSSTAAGMGGVGQSNYAASKAGLIGLARSLARETARSTTTVNVVAPGLVRTGMAETLPDAVRAQIVEDIPMRRMGEAREVAELIHFLGSEGASYITGAVVAVDGGLSMGL